jgi:hypothetical protein
VFAARPSREKFAPLRILGLFAFPPGGRAEFPLRRSEAIKKNGVNILHLESCGDDSVGMEVRLYVFSQDPHEGR